MDDDLPQRRDHGGELHAGRLRWCPRGGIEGCTASTRPGAICGRSARRPGNRSRVRLPEARRGLISISGAARPQPDGVLTELEPKSTCHWCATRTNPSHPQYQTRPRQRHGFSPCTTGTSPPRPSGSCRPRPPRASTSGATTRSSTAGLPTTSSSWRAFPVALDGQHHQGVTRSRSSLVRAGRHSKSTESPRHSLPKRMLSRAWRTATLSTGRYAHREPEGART